ncbi:MerR family transcriptional regulator [Eisenbergiella porci]|uniref:MerR family transcriptional regulator n=1 Tax=Eisenbergiella porci TaxID=2652274 RepID=UPI0022DFE896|nr:MerR family transcriptional regulator [Eisenbergiella porci]
MLKIGDFAMLSKISINMLRHYDEINLLKPANIDDFTGYRYYEEEQLLIANRIQSLKAMGLSLSMIKQILEQYENSNSLKNFLQIQRTQKLEDLEALKKQILKLDTAIKSLEENSKPTNCDISIKEIPKRKVVSYTRQINSYDEENLLWEELNEQTQSLNLHYTTPSFDIAIFHEYNQNGLLVEVQRGISDTYDNFGQVQFKDVSPIKVASLTYKGEYPNLQQVNADVAKWIKDNGYELNGNMFNIYHISPKTESETEKMLTEVCFPVKNK